MKFLAIAIFSLFAVSANAAIENSSLELRHQNLIEQAVTAKCGFNRGLVEVSTITTEIRVDQGIVDYKFDSVFEMTVRIDQGIFDTYVVRVLSSYYDHYDHNAKDWGVYEIDSVSNCELK